MVYLFESNLPESKSILFALTYVFGLGESNSLKICKKLGFSKNLKVKDLSKEQVSKISLVVEKLSLTISSDLKKSKIIKIKNLVSIKSYKGFRLKQGLPVRGQRTHTNGKTSRKRL